MARFAKDFLWGAASASYQIEGGVKEGGRGPSIWDVFSHTPGKIKNGDTGDRAADSFRRFREDVALLKEMGLKAYRFSIAWPRVAPKGNTEWNQAGFDYYLELLDALLEAGIEPWVTLYHWDLPQALQEKGGWQNPEIVPAFGAYAAEAGRRFQGRAVRWFVLNEPQCFLGLGYGEGVHAPGLTLGPEALADCWTHMLEACALGASALREADPANRIGAASTGKVCYPASDRPEDATAARQAMFSCGDSRWYFTYPMFLDPLCLGRWPEALEPALRERLEASDCLRRLRGARLDFIGANIYNGVPVRKGDGGPEEVPWPVGGPRTAIGWTVSPEALEWGPRFLSERYGLPLYISENGVACLDRVFLDGGVHDPDRIDFLARCLLALDRAIAAGADVRGYFHWSLTDNFEWAEGYDQRFGLAYVDYAAGARILKDSGRWYGTIAASNGRDVLSGK